MYSNAFHPAKLTVAAGTFAIFLVNPNDPPGNATQGLAIGKRVGDAIVSSNDVKVGDSAVLTVFGLPAGEYLVWCTIPTTGRPGWWER